MTAFFWICADSAAQIIPQEGAPMDSYQTLSQPGRASLVVKKSEFIAVASPAQDEKAALEQLNQIRAEHPKARHTAYAYVLQEGMRTRHSDDGEPAKTAGLPILNAIQGADITDCIVTVTRYFGGTLLGTGGLVHAYGGAASDAIKAASIAIIRRCVTIKICLSYPYYENAMRVLEANEAAIEEPLFTDKVSITAIFPQENSETVEKSLTEITRGEAVITMSSPFYHPL